MLVKIIIFMMYFLISKVKTLEWNADSSILVIWMVDHIVQEMDKPANNYCESHFDMHIYAHHIHN